MATRDWIRLISASIVLLAVQILVLNNLNLNQYMFPQLYIMVLITLPINLKHWIGYLIAFVLGFILDGFSYTPGLQAFTGTAIMFLRYEYFNRLVDKEWLSTGVRPTFGLVDTGWFVTYTTIFTFLFHFILFTIEDFNFFGYSTTLLKILYSSSLAVFLILLFQFTFNRVQLNDE